MTFDSVVFDLVERFPELNEAVWKWMEPDEFPAYMAFPELVDFLKEALASGCTADVLRVCEFVEEAARSGDRNLEDLVRIEVGEHLGWIEHEDRLTPYLGAETKRICGYVPGLATQRLELRREREALTVGQRVLQMLRRDG